MVSLFLSLSFLLCDMIWCQPTEILEDDRIFLLGWHLQTILKIKIAVFIHQNILHVESEDAYSHTQREMLENEMMFWLQSAKWAGMTSKYSENRIYFVLKAGERNSRDGERAGVESCYWVTRTG